MTQKVSDRTFFRAENHGSARKQLCALASAVSQVVLVSTTRRDHDHGDIHYQLFAEFERKAIGDEVGIVSTTRPDAEFVAACLAFAPMIAGLLGCQHPANTTTTAKRLLERVGAYACGQIDGEVMRRALEPGEAAAAYRALAAGRKSCRYACGGGFVVGCSPLVDLRSSSYPRNAL